METLTEKEKEILLLCVRSEIWYGHIKFGDKVTQEDLETLIKKLTGETIK